MFIICRNEADYLPIWLKYYRKYISDHDSYILDNGSDDGSTSNLTVHIRRVISQKYVDHYWHVDAVRDQTRHLLNLGYTSVRFTEIDEIVVPDPNKYPLGLSDYIQRKRRKAVRVHAFDVRHDVGK